MSVVTGGGAEAVMPPVLVPVPTAAHKCIKTEEDKNAFLASSTCADLKAFVAALNEAAKDTKLSDVNLEAATDKVKQVLAMLDTMLAWVDAIPPLEQPMRFGNKAFRSWHVRLREEVPGMVTDLLPADHADDAAELAVYLEQSFGSPERIDYGTGHETNFVVFLLCLHKLGVFADTDLPAVALGVFHRYLAVCRKLQRTYWLEPAGSHGVWSLDDYHLLPFLFGSAQLYSHRHIKPKSIHNEEVMEGFTKEYIYFQSIAFINSVKHGAPFAEHSPVLNDISGLKTWSKVNEGMTKMYVGEVLNKFPVMQHMYFGKVYPASWLEDPKKEAE